MARKCNHDLLRYWGRNAGVICAGCAKRWNREVGYWPANVPAQRKSILVSDYEAYAEFERKVHHAR